MSQSVYSTRFALGEIPVGGALEYDVPAGMVAIITCATYNPESMPAGAALRVQGTVVWQQAAVAATSGEPQSVQFDGRVVVNPGENLSLTPNAAGSGQISGYLLSAP